MLKVKRLVAKRHDDEGAALVTVVVVMLIGFVIATTIAASVLVTISANSKNADRTDAFIAAESGRDAVRAYLAGACSMGDFPIVSGGDVKYSATIKVTAGAQPVPPLYPGATAGCPVEATAYVVITSTGTGPDGSSTTIDSVYLWEKKPRLQAGGVLAYYAGSLSLRANYTGDIVVRKDGYTCENDGTINGSLYVTRGSVTLSRACVVNGNVWARDDLDASSQQINVTGNVKVGRDAKFTSNGTVLGTPSGGGNVEAGGKITLTDTGSNGHIFGKLTAGGLISVGTKWVVDGGVNPVGTPVPDFDPDLEFIRTITQWIDLDSNSGWNTGTPVDGCSLSANQLTAKLTDGATTPMMIDFRSCSASQTNIDLGGASTNAVTKDAIFLAPAGKKMNVSLGKNLSGGKQLLFVHSDSSRDLQDGERFPDCGIGNQNDSFSIANGVNATGVKIMIYTPCGLTGNIRQSFVGQLYSKDASGVTFTTGATYTCATMSWPTAFEKLGCRVLGEGSDSVVETVIDQKLGSLVSQSER